MQIQMQNRNKIPTESGKQIPMVFVGIPFLWLISGQTWETHFDAVYFYSPFIADSVEFRKHTFTHFRVPLLLALILGQAWEPDVGTIFCDLEPLVDLRRET